MARSRALDRDLPHRADASRRGRGDQRAGWSKGIELRAIAVRCGQGLRGKPRTGRRQADGEAAGKGGLPSRSARLRTGASASRRIPRHRFGAGPHLRKDTRRRVGTLAMAKTSPEKSLFVRRARTTPANRQALLANSVRVTSPNRTGTNSLSLAGCDPIWQAFRVVLPRLWSRPVNGMRAIG